MGTARSIRSRIPSGSQALDEHFLARPIQGGGVEVVVLDGEADVLRRVAQVVLLVEIAPARQPGRALLRR